MRFTPGVRFNHQALVSKPRGLKVLQKNLYQKLFHMGEDHVLNVNLRVKLVIPFIFTDIQRVKTWLFDKCKGTYCVQRWFIYSAMALWIVSRQNHLVFDTVSFTILFVPITPVRWPSHRKCVARLTNILFISHKWPRWCQSLRKSSFDSGGKFYFLSAIVKRLVAMYLCYFFHGNHKVHFFELVLWFIHFSLEFVCFLCSHLSLSTFHP